MQVTGPLQLEHLKNHVHQCMKDLSVKWNNGYNAFSHVFAVTILKCQRGSNLIRQSQQCFQSSSGYTQESDMNHSSWERHHLKVVPAEDTLKTGVSAVFTIDICNLIVLRASSRMACSKQILG